MIAGFGAYFEQEIGINRIIGSIVLNLLCVIVFFSNIKGVLKASNLFVPFLILTVYVCANVAISFISIFAFTAYNPHVVP